VWQRQGRRHGSVVVAVTVGHIYQGPNHTDTGPMHVKIGADTCQLSKNRES
jgi:hypothetical protein